jgi:hypothetical protein
VVSLWEPLPESLESAPPEVPPPEADSVVESEVEADVVDDPEGAGPDEVKFPIDLRAA